MSSERFSAGDTAWAAHTHIEYDGVPKASVVELKVVVIEGSSVVCRWPSGGMWAETLDSLYASEEEARDAAVERIQAAIGRITSFHPFFSRQASVMSFSTAFPAQSLRATRMRPLKGGSPCVLHLSMR